MKHISNKYWRWYKAIMKRARKRSLIVGFERHHVVPRSLGGNNLSENIVRLTYREHFLVHWMLIKFLRGNDKKKMAHALHRLTSSKNHGYLRTSWQYELAKKYLVATMVGRKVSSETCAKLSKGKSGRNNPSFGKSPSKKTRARLSEAISGENHPNYGKALPPEVCAKISATLTGRKASRKTKAKMSRSRRGKNHPMFGKHHSKKTCAKIRATKAKNPWSEEKRAAQAERARKQMKDPKNRRRVGKKVKRFWASSEGRKVIVEREAKRVARRLVEAMGVPN